MNGVPQSGITRIPGLPSLRAAVKTPEGLKLSSRGQGHGFGARRPRMAPPPYILPTPKGSNRSAPPGPRDFSMRRCRGFHPRLLM
jgi:hypothetical protein